MWRITAAVVGVLALASCASAGANHDAPSPSPSPAPSNPPVAAQAVAAALAFASHSDPEVGVVDGYASVPPAVQRGQQPIALGGGQANRAPSRPPTGSPPSNKPPSGALSTVAPSASSKTLPAGSVSGHQGRCCW